MKRLVQAGADVNATDKDGNTAVMSCFDAGATKVLIEAGADLTIVNKEHKNALQMARRLWSAEAPDHEQAKIIREAMIKQGLPLE
jgi:ankyrin repeat protein